jgi:predicted metal-dependent peptidase
MTIEEKVEDKIKTARALLYKFYPFYSPCCYLTLVPDRNIYTTATDGRNLFFNPEALDKLDESDIVWLLIHEYYHILEDSFGRLPRGIDPLDWNIATDVVNNVLILDSGFNRSKHGIEATPAWVQKAGRNKLAEEVLADMMKKRPKCKACEAGTPFPQPNPHNNSPDKQDGSGQGGDQKSEGNKGQGDGKQDGKAGTPFPQPNSPDKQDGSGQGGDQKSEGNKGQGDGKQDGKGGCGGNNQQHTCAGLSGCVTITTLKKDGGTTPEEKLEWQQRAIAAATLAKTQGNLPGHLEKLLGRLLAPKVHWHDYIRKWATKSFQKKYTFLKKSRRQSEFDLRMISRIPKREGAAVAIDTSGSMSRDEIIRCISETYGILMACGAEYVDIYLHDTDCYRKWRMTKGDVGGDLGDIRQGGTSHISVLEQIEKESQGKVKLVIAFTDLYTSFPTTPPPFHIVWGYTPQGANQKVPYGEKVLVEL